MQGTTTGGEGARQAGANGKTPKECDLDMKGGISGVVVYPPLVIKLHEVGGRR